MRIPPTLRVCSGLLCSVLMLIAGCSTPSSQNLASLTVSVTPSSVPVGGAAVLKATAHLSDGTTQDVTAGTTWTVSNPALGTVTNGALTAIAAGTLTLQAAYVETTPAGTSPAATSVSPQNLSASTQVAITPASSTTSINVPVISWSAPAPITYGTALSNAQLNATANVPGAFVYAQTTGAVLTAGTQTLSTTFTPTDTKTYSSATASVQLSVNQAAPTVNWATPAAILTGTALSATQLDATASVPGSFMYSPAVGAVLAAGTQQLTAVFSPTDATDYSAVTAKTSLLVSSSPVSNPTPTPTPTPTPSPTPTPTPIPTPTGCGGPTINLNSSMSTSTLQSNLSSAPNCALILFAPGTYNITAGLTIPCGVTVTAATPATPSNVILSASFPEESSDVFKINGGCTNATSVSYLSSLHAGLLFVYTPSSNLTVTHNQANDLKCCNSQAYAPALYFAAVNNNPSYMLTNATVTWNQLGDSTSCTTPMDAMTDFDSPEDYQGGCAGIIIGTSVNGMTIENNKVFHVGEGMHVECSGNCYPNAFTTTNLVVQYNDFDQIHRIAWEEQPQTTSGVVFQYNSLHDWMNAYFGSFGVSFACCGQGASSPWLNVSNNVIIQNTTPHFEPPYGYGYGSEDWGLNATYDHNWIGSGNFNLGAPGMTWGYGNVSDMSYNTVCGNGFAGSGYIDSEFGTVAPNMTDNVKSTTCSGVTSAMPSIAPSAGAQTYPLTVTLTDQGLTTGSQPLSNTGIWYTTDGSTPVPGSGTAQYLASGGTFVLNAAATVKAVGMWGAANQPSSYASGFGFVPSSVVTANYSASGAVKRPVAGARTTSSPNRNLGRSPWHRPGQRGLAIGSNHSSATSGGYRKHHPVEGDRDL